MGAGIGAIIGGKGAAWGAGIGAVVGGSAGAIIGNKMDKQKKELEQINGAQVESINDGQAIKVTLNQEFICNKFKYIKFCFTKRTKHRCFIK